MRVPDEAGKGKARVTFSFDAWKAGQVAPSTVEIPIGEPLAEKEQITEAEHREEEQARKVSGDLQNALTAQGTGSVVSEQDMKAAKKAMRQAANERLAQHLWAHRDDLFTFLCQPGLDATNWRAELAVASGSSCARSGEAAGPG